MLNHAKHRNKKIILLSHERKYTHNSFICTFLDIHVFSITVDDIWLCNLQKCICANLQSEDASLSPEKHLDTLNCFYFSHSDQRFKKLQYVVCGKKEKKVRIYFP